MATRAAHLRAVDDPTGGFNRWRFERALHILDIPRATIADLCHVHERVVDDWCDGWAEPFLVDVERVADLIGVHPSLFYGHPTTVTPPVGASGDATLLPFTRTPDSAGQPALF